MATIEAEAALDVMNIDAELEGFLDNKASAAVTGMVNLQPQSNMPGLSQDVPSGKMDSSTGEGSSRSGAAAAVAAGAAAAVGAAASALMGAKSGVGNDFAGQAMAGAVGSMAMERVPTSLEPAKERASALLAGARPWKEFILPLSVPAGSESCGRVTANLYHFQANYAILFMVQLMFAVVLQPTELVTIAVIVILWFLFLKKNGDPDWQVSIGGMQLGAWQRWLVLASITVIVMLIMCGSTIFSAAFFYIIVALVHGVVHDSSGMASTTGGEYVPYAAPVLPDANNV